MSELPDREWALADLRAHIKSPAASPIDSELLALGSGDEEQRLTEALTAVLPFFEHWKLITGGVDRQRYTQHLHLPVPERVGRLSSRGRCVASRSPLQRTGFFLFVAGLAKLNPIWKHFRMAIVVAGMVLTIAKLVLEWGTIPAAAAAIGAAIMAMILAMLATGGS